jgi:hypothetical protein
MVKKNCKASPVPTSRGTRRSMPPRATTSCASSLGGLVSRERATDPMHVGGAGEASNSALS